MNVDLRYTHPLPPPKPVKTLPYLIYVNANFISHFYTDKCSSNWGFLLLFFFSTIKTDSSTCLIFVCTTLALILLIEYIEFSADWHKQFNVSVSYIPYVLYTKNCQLITNEIY